jgi:hypothetical protein
MKVAQSHLDRRFHGVRMLDSVLQLFTFDPLHSSQGFIHHRDGVKYDQVMTVQKGCHRAR